MPFRNYLSWTIFCALALWGPIDHSWPFWFGFRVGYLILIPLAVWWLLGLVWEKWENSYKAESILNRLLSGIICTVLLALAKLETQSKTHTGNTEWIQTRDGMEAIGDYILLEGPNWEKVILLVVIAGFVFWFGVFKRKTISDES